MIEPPQAPRFDPSLRAKLILAAAAALLWGLLFWAQKTRRLQRADFAIYDFLIHAHPREPSSDVVIVAIDEKSLRELGPQRKWGREKYAELVTALGEAEALVVAFDILFTQRSEAKDAKGTAGDRQFVETIDAEDAPSTILAANIAGSRLKKPFDPLTQVAFYQGLVNLEEGVGGIVRSVPIAFKVVDDPEGDAIDFFGFGIYAAAVYESILDGKDTVDMSLEKHQIADEDFFPAFPASIGQVPRYSFVDVMEKKRDEAAFRDKLVFVGSTINPNDRFRVPISRRGKLALGHGIEVETNVKLMPGVELHAITASSLLADTFIRVNQNRATAAALAAGAALIILLGTVRFIPLGARLSAMAIAIAGTGAAYEILWRNRSFLHLAILPLAAVSATVTAIFYEIHVARLRNRGLKNIFGRYVSPDVMKKILSDPSRLSWSEDRVVTVLFCDIRAFTPMAERLEPTEALQLLNTYFEAATRAVLSTSGSVDKFAGDEIMAVFNAPLDLPRHALAGICAGLKIIQSLEEVNRTLTARGLPEIAVGIGIHTGTVVAGNIGSTVRTEYGIIGDTVNTAARLVSAARAGEILVSEKAIDQAGDSVAAEKGDRLALKGKSETVQVYRIIGTRDADSQDS